MSSQATLLDTNVLSELLRPEADPRVVAFVAEQGDPWVSAIVFHELEFGLSLLPEGQRKQRLGSGIRTFQFRFRDRIVPVDINVATTAGEMRAREVKAGYEPDALDMLIAASAKICSARLATRNTKDFLRTEIELVNPWTP